MVWSEDKIKKLKKMWQVGKPTAEIAKTLGMSKNSIIGKVHRLNLKVRPSPIKADTAKPVLQPYSQTVPEQPRQSGTVSITYSITTAQEELSRLEAAVEPLKAEWKRILNRSRQHPAWHMCKSTPKPPQPIPLSTRARRKQRRRLRPAVTY